MLSEKIKRIVIGIILFILIGVGVYFLYKFSTKETYSSFFIDNNSNYDLKKELIIVPPFQEDYFKHTDDYNEYQHDNRQISIKKYPWLKNSYIGQSQRPQDSHTPQSFTSF